MDRFNRYHSLSLVSLNCSSFLRTFSLLITFATIFLCSQNVMYAQAPDWVNFPLGGMCVQDIAFDSLGNPWIGGFGGLAHFNGVDWKVYTYTNSPLPGDVLSIAIDKTGAVWVCTFSFGVVKFDGTNWIKYTAASSGLPSDWVEGIAVDQDGNIWIGTDDEGLVKFDGENWTVYPCRALYDIAIDDSGNVWIGTVFDGLKKLSKTGKWSAWTMANSDIPSDRIRTLKIGHSRTIWTGTIFGGIAKFDSKGWTVYDTTNSDLPHNNVWGIDFDESGIIWIGTMDGLAKFNIYNKNWTIYNPGNSGLPSSFIRALGIDPRGNKWFGTLAGVAVYHEGGVILGVEETYSARIPSIFSLSQNYPNPFNQNTEMCFSVPKQAHVRIVISNILGEFVHELTNREYAPGTYQVQWNGTNSTNTPVSSGIYIYRMKTEAGLITRKMMLLR